MKLLFSLAPSQGLTVQTRFALHMTSPLDSPVQSTFYICSTCLIGKILFIFSYSG